MAQFTRREFLGTVASGLTAAAVGRATPADRVSFFLIGDTHYLANATKPGELDAASRVATSGLVDWLNRLPGTVISEAAGGGTVASPLGVIHAGDLIDSGDRNTPAFQAMQKTEWAAFEADYGLTGRDGRLTCPVYEVHGNHDAPGGEGLVIDQIKQRNQKRPGKVNVSANGLHYSWDWGPVHFVNLGIVVGAVSDVTRKRRYPPLDSLPFLIDDLARHVKDRTRPVILTHHVDVLRYSDAPDAKTPPRNPEWDPVDVRGYYDAIKGFNVLGVFYGHTHTRNVFRWDGTKVRATQGGIPVFNTDNAGHFREKTQAFLYAEITETELVVREFATKDVWKTGGWTPLVWRIPLMRR